MCSTFFSSVNTYALGLNQPSLYFSRWVVSWRDALVLARKLSKHCRCSVLITQNIWIRKMRSRCSLEPQKSSAVIWRKSATRWAGSCTRDEIANQSTKIFPYYWNILHVLGNINDKSLMSTVHLTYTHSRNSVIYLTLSFIYCYSSLNYLGCSVVWLFTVI